MNSKPEVQGKLTPEVIRDAVPWSEIGKVVLIFENQFGDMCCLVSDEASKGYFIDLAELQIMNTRVFKRLTGGASL